MNVRSLQFFYRVLLGLLPRGFTTVFGEEMQTVFTDVVTEAAGRGLVSLMQAALTELGSLPLEALRLHLTAPKTLSGGRGAGWEGLPTRKESLLVLILFALPLLGLYYQNPAFHSTRWPVYLACGLVLGVLLAGFLSGFPRWSLPYLGQVLSTGCFVVIMEYGADLFSPLVLEKLAFLPKTENTRLIVEALWSGILWLSLFAMIALAIGLLALLKRCQPMLQRIRQDWTLGSYILYSGVAAALGLSFARHLSKNIYAIASILCLALGAWLFLRSPHVWQRLLALLGGLTCAVYVAAAGQWPLHPLDAWESRLWWAVTENSGSLLAAVEWGWMAAILLAPALFHLYPRRSGPHSSGPHECGLKTAFP
jgi:hypothetical protein